MKKRLLLPMLLALAGLGGCGLDQEKVYDEAKSVAQKSAASPGTIGLGLRFGMSEAEVYKHLAELRERGELVFRLDFGSLPIAPEPEFLNGKLARFRMMLEGDGLPGDLHQTELLKLLDAEYGGTHYRHGIENLDARSWFKGDMEVALTCIPARGYWLSYTRLKNEWPLVQQHMRADSIRQAQEAQKL